MVGSGGRRLKTKKKSFSCCKQSGSLPKWQPSIVNHQQGTDPISKGNLLPDQAVKEVATQPSPTVGPESIFKVLLAPELPPSLRDTKEEGPWTLNEGRMKETESW